MRQSEDKNKLKISHTYLKSLLKLSVAHFVLCALCTYMFLFQACGALQSLLAIVYSAALVVGLLSNTFQNDGNDKLIGREEPREMSDVLRQSR